jgi:hypothetical protein
MTKFVSTALALFYQRPPAQTRLRPLDRLKPGGVRYFSNAGFRA